MKSIREKIEKIMEDTLDNYRNSITRKRYVEDMEKIKSMCVKTEPADTDFTLIKHLTEIYHPEQSGILSALEEDQIRTCLQIEGRSVLQLRNLRDMVVMVGDLINIDIDRISAITHVIDSEILRQGAEV